MDQGEGAAARMSDVRKATAIAAVNLRRLVRDKTGAFFVFVFPFLLILALGATFGANVEPKLGVVVAEGPLAAGLARRLETAEGLAVRRFADPVAMRAAVEDGSVEGGLAIPEDFDRAVEDGDVARLTYWARPTGEGRELRTTVAAAVDAEAVTLTAARFALARGAVTTFDEGMARAEIVARARPGVRVIERTPGGEAAPGGLEAAAAQELILFIFVTSLSASAMLIETRRLGLSRRMLATPTPVRVILGGETLGRFAIAILQGVTIVIGTAVLFRVSWGNLLTTSLTVMLFALTATGAAMLLGSVLKNATQAGALGVFLGLVLAALGGAMVPLELFPPVMATIARLTPHAWAIDALTESMAADASPVEVATQLGVLLIYGLGLLAIATMLFRRTLTSRAG
jgi:ABC-2 type transport system permease protein